MNHLKRVTIMISIFFAILFFQVTTVKAEDVEICIDENKELEVFYEYVSTGGDFVIDDQSVVSVESPEIADVVKKGGSSITWVSGKKVYKNTLSITGLSEGTTKVYLDKPYTGLALHIEVATETVTQHQWESEYRIDIEPTCLLDGQKAIYCEKCLKKQDSSEMTIPAKGHTEVTDTAVEPTCTEKGKTEGSHCSECGEVIKLQETVEAYGHKFTDYVLDDNATCAKEGTKTAVCDNGCGAKDTIVIEGSKKEHTWNSGEITKEATCASIGEKTYTCIVCRESIKEKIPQTNIHTWDSGRVTIEATVNSRGEKTYTCTVCNVIKTEMIPNLVESPDTNKNDTTNNNNSNNINKEKENQTIQFVANKKINAKKVKKKAQSFKLSAKSTSGNNVLYKLVKKNKNITFSATSGNVTVKKGTKIKIRVK